jgi:hypothetical protein
MVAHRTPIPIQMDDAHDQMRDWGYRDDQFVARFEHWHRSGAAIVLFANADVRSHLRLALGIALQVDVPSDGIWPQCAPDGDDYAGWRYLPDQVVLP